MRNLRIVFAYKLFHNLKFVKNKFLNRAIGLLKYMYDYKILYICILYIFSTLLSQFLLRNIWVGQTIGLVASFPLVLLAYILSIFMLKLVMEILKGEFCVRRIGSIFVFFKCRFVLVLLVILLGYVRCVAVVFQERELEGRSKSFTLGNTELDGFVAEEPVLKHDKQVLTFSILQGNGNNGLYDGNILVSLPRYYVYKIGQVCKLKGQLVEPENFLEFDYKSYLKKDKIYLIAENPEFECEDIKKERSGFFLRNILVDFKDSLIENLDAVLLEPQSSLLVGILFGQKRLFSNAFEKYVRLAGVSHIVAASGYNVSILIIAVNSCLFFLRRKSKTITSLIVVWCFTLLSGLSASITRACIMTSISLLATLWGRGTSIHISLPLTSVIFLIFDPYIFSDVGFQLSLLATMGLVYIAPIILEAKKRLTTRFLFIEEYMISTMSCTISTLPVSIFVFKTFSLWSVFANTLILPIVESTMLWGVLSIVIQAVHQPFSYLLFTVVNIQLKYFEYIVDVIGKLNWGAFDIPDSLSSVISIVLLSLIIFLSILFYPLENEKQNYYLRNIR